MGWFGGPPPRKFKICKLAISVIKPHRYCIGNKLLIVEGGDFHICYANIRSNFTCNYALKNNFLMFFFSPFHFETAISHSLFTL